jgi:hypothetical protein
LALATHYLGASKNETLRKQADLRLMKTFYGGEKNKFDWYKFVSVHKWCHNDMEATGPPSSEDDKVQHLLNGIDTSKLETAILFVWSSPLLMSNFDATIDSITTVVENIKDSLKRPFQQLSSAETGRTTGGQGRGTSGRNSLRGGHGACSRHSGQGGHGSHGHGEPWTKAITSQWYQGHKIARMSAAQRLNVTKCMQDDPNTMRHNAIQPLK